MKDSIKIARKLILIYFFQTIKLSFPEINYLNKITFFMYDNYKKKLGMLVQSLGRFSFTTVSGRWSLNMHE
jgi:hypothetical protein